MKISHRDTRVDDRGDIKVNFYVEKSAGQGFTALIVDVMNGRYKTRLEGATRGYLVIEGSGRFTINGQDFTVEANDLFVINTGDEYEYTGHMKLFEFNVPTTDRSNKE
jgi:mannose-6-phosphate isomerase-like protein (cupin superfamily)